MRVRATTHRDPEPLDLSAFERLGAFVLRLEETPEQAELSIALVDEAEMERLNEQYRGADGSTDVLSFGCDDPCPAGGDEPITLGDVIVAPQVAERQAIERERTIEAELDLLVVHGILHILGYTHEGDEDGDAMEARERAILSAWADHR